MESSRYASRRERRRRQRWVFMAATASVALVVVVVAYLVATTLAASGGGSGPANSEEVAAGDRGDATAEDAENPDAENAGGATNDAGEETYERALTPETGEEAPAAPGGKPEAVRGVYVSGPVAGSENFDAYIGLANETEVNALVVDVKEAGVLQYPSDVPLAQEIGATTETIPDLAALVERMKEDDVYAIARLSVFQDDVLPRQRPDMAVMDSVTGEPWLTYMGATWSSAYNRDVWEYNVAVAKEAAEAGFDEVQFDYVRFPSDGPMNRITYPEETYPTQEDAIAGFLEYARGELEPTGVELSADVFGLVGMNDYVGIGQVVSKMAPHLDVICPMVYPSHYPVGSYGYQNPNAEPYAIIEGAMNDFERAYEVNPDIEIRPWLQDFNWGDPEYGPEEVEAQIQATYDTGHTGWLLWNAANVYTAEALEPEGQGGGPEEPDN